MNRFPLLVVLPFTLVAAGSAALLSKLVDSWPAYPKPLARRQSFLHTAFPDSFPALHTI